MKAAVSSPDTLGTSTTLIDLVRLGDASAWQRLVTIYGPLVRVWCRRGKVRETDIPDVFQEAFGAVSGQIDRFRRDREGDSFRGWLWTIVRNQIANHFRKVVREPAALGGTSMKDWMQNLPMDEPAEWSVDAGEQCEPAVRVLPLIQAEFEEKTWRAFWETAIEGRTPADVADDLEMTRHAVYKAKSRVLQRIRAELGEAETR